MIEHRHHVPGRALRLLLARLHNNLAAEILIDLNSEVTLIKEIGGCGSCWFRVADELADMIIAEVKGQIREDPHKNLEGFIRLFEHNLAEQLDHTDDEDAA